MEWLKKSQGLGHFQAAVIVQHLATGGTGEYEDEASLVAGLFSGDNAGLKVLFDTLSSEVRKIGADVSAKPCKTYVPFYRKWQFLVVKPSIDAILLGVPLVNDGLGPTTFPAKGLGFPEKMIHALRLEPSDKIPEDLLSLIRYNYEQNG
jgi:hypothetical protein